MVLCVFVADNVPVWRTAFVCPVAKPCLFSEPSHYPLVTKAQSRKRLRSWKSFPIVQTSALTIIEKRMSATVGERMAAAATVNWTRTPNRILVASSDPRVRARVLQSPEFLGVERMEASGGAQALARLKETFCDGVLLDRNLADLDAR